MWGDAMRAVEQYLEDLTFTPPDLTELLGDLTTVPSVSGMTVDDATDTLESAGFTVLVGEARDSSYAYGTVAYTSPSGGESYPEGAPVTIYPSTGQAPAPPPAPTPSGGGNGGGGGNNGGGGNGGGGGNNGNGNGGGRGRG
jgi:hypothetical protein